MSGKTGSSQAKLKVKKLVEEERFYVANRYNETIVDHLENTPEPLTS